MNQDHPQSKADNLAMIVEYIIECRGKGLFLPPSEITLVQSWLEATPHIDVLILTLSEVLPEFFNDGAERRFPRSLKGVNKKIHTRLKLAASRQLTNVPFG